MDISELEQEESRSPMSVDVADGHSNATPHNASADSLEGPARAWNEPATPITNPVRPRLPKLKVVLDLDETLLHCKINPGTSAAELGCHSMARSGVAQGNGTQTSRMVEELAVRLEDPNRQLVRVFKRPGVDEFLRLASEKYDLYAFTASESFYARPLLRLLDPNGTIFKKQFYRDTCKLFRDGIFAKDLHCIFGSAEEEGAGLVDPLSRVVLVDNNPLSFIPQGW